MVVFSSLVQFNEIQYCSDNSVIFIYLSVYLFSHLIFLVIYREFQYRNTAVNNSEAYKHGDESNVGFS